MNITWPVSNPSRVVPTYKGESMIDNNISVISYSQWIVRDANQHVFKHNFRHIFQYELEPKFYFTPIMHLSQVYLLYTTLDLCIAHRSRTI